MLKLVIGNKKYSSWSMRPWVVLKHAGVPFEEQVIGLDQADTGARIAQLGAAGRVPVLSDGALTVWDSLAICEYINERVPEAQLWPATREARAQARSACAEMHSGFHALREHLPMKVQQQPLALPDLTPVVTRDIARICTLWRELRHRHASEGPYLFGRFSIADAYFAPVAIGRLLAYGVPLDKPAREYAETLALNPAVCAWVEGAHRETLRAPLHE